MKEDAVRTFPTISVVVTLVSISLGIGQPDPPFPECGITGKETDIALGCAISPAACNE